jgi:hypothetical protein
MRCVGLARLLRAACCVALAAIAAATRDPPLYNAPIPPVVRVCVMIYPPFTLERVRRWRQLPDRSRSRGP